jgi:hypothetical protein
MHRSTDLEGSRRKLTLRPWRIRRTDSLVDHWKQHFIKKSRRRSEMARDERRRIILKAALAWLALLRRWCSPASSR